MTEFLHGLHSGLRYLVLLAGVAALVVAALGWFRRDEAAAPNPGEHAGASAARDAGRAGRVTMGIFVGLLDTQVLVGVILLFVWPFYPQLIGHISMMVLAAAAAHAGSVIARRRTAGRSAAAVRLAAIGITLVLIVGGILAIERPIF